MNIPASNVNILPAPIVIGVGALGFHRYASQFLEAFKSLPAGENFSTVPFYLVGHSVELAFKAFLISQNAVNFHQLKKIGHDLIKAHKKAVENGLNKHLTLLPCDLDELKKANKFYKSKKLEYFSIDLTIVNRSDLPDLKLLSILAVNLMTSIENECLRSNVPVPKPETLTLGQRVRGILRRIYRSSP